MRFEHLAVRAADEELGMAFHDRLTIVSSLGAGERREMVELLLAALVGGRHEASLLRYVDATGRTVLVDSDGMGAVSYRYEDGSPAPDPLAPLPLDLATLRRLSHVRGADVELLSAPADGPVPPELDEARRTLAALGEELESADDAQRELESLRFQLAAIDEQLRDVTAGADRRQFARLVLQLQQVRAEADLATEHVGLASADEAMVAAGPDVQNLGRRWAAANARADEQRQLFGSRPRLDADALADARRAPVAVPPELPQLVAALERAEAMRAELEAQLPAPSRRRRQKKPSHPAIPDLARADQDALWRTASAAQAADQRVNEASLALGGLEAGGMTPAIADELDNAHAELEEADAAAYRAKSLTRAATVMAGILSAGCLAVLAEGAGPKVSGLPLLPLVAGAAVLAAAGAAGWFKVAPRKRLEQARVREATALDRAGVPTYLAFHMRRIDPTLDRTARHSLEQALADQVRAADRWIAVAGNISPEQALALEEEVRGHAAALRELEGDGCDDTRRRLVDEVEPALEQARAAVLAACAPFGITDPNPALDEVARLVELSRTARLQLDLEDAEAAEASATEALTNALDQLGSTGTGPLDDRMRDFDAALAEAANRQRARAGARPVAAVEADLVRLEAEVRLQARPGWALSASPADAEEPDTDALLSARTELYAASAAAERRIPDVQRLRDRVDTVTRRVLLLETQAGVTGARGQAEPSQVEAHLLGRLAAARRAGGAESLPLLMDEPFAGMDDAHVEGLLDLVERLTGQMQMIYLTDDERVVTWARARQAHGSFILLEPTPESV